MKFDTVVHMKNALQCMWTYDAHISKVLRDPVEYGLRDHANRVQRGRKWGVRCLPVVKSWTVWYTYHEIHDCCQNVLSG